MMMMIDDDDDGDDDKTSMMMMMMIGRGIVLGQWQCLSKVRAAVHFD